VTRQTRQKNIAEEAVTSLSPAPEGYSAWLADVKVRIQTAQMRASLAVNQELLTLYWGIGRDLLERRERSAWGDGVIDRAAHDLKTEFPDLTGFSRSNLKYMRAFAEAWPEAATIRQQPVGQLPWGTNLVLLTKLKDRATRLAYAASAVENGWSRASLTLHIEQQTVERTGRALNNFEALLPAPLSDLARESLKDPYRFDFLSLSPQAAERDIEEGLVAHVSRFLIELGAGFAYVGRQVPLEVDGRDFFVDLLFYHLRLRCFVVVELKAGEFEPEHVGKLNFYLSAVDAQMRAEHDAPTIGLLLCKTRSRVIVEYALRDTTKPMGVAEYEIVTALPKKLQSSLPSIQQIEKELTRTGVDPDTQARNQRGRKRK
jgi:predicted nuclease of restriction endonuclease-like (RecB) superfamily